MPNEFKIKNGLLVSGSITGVTESSSDDSAKMASTSWVRTYLTNNGASASGTTNYLAKFTGSSSIGNSLIFDNGTNVLIGTTTAPAAVMGVSFPLSVTSAQTTRIRIDSTQTVPNAGVGLYANGVQKFSFAMFGATSDFTIYNDALLSSSILVKGDTNNVLIGSLSDNGARLQVSGAATFSNQITGPSGAVNEGKFNFIGYNNGYGGITANTGFDSSYNSVILYSNFNSTRSGQGNTSLPTWYLDLGGSLPNQDSFSIFRSSAGSFSFSNLFKLTSTGAATFSSSVQGNRFFSVGSLNSTDGSFYIDHPGVQTWKIGITNSNTSTFSIGNDNGGVFATKYFNIGNDGAMGFNYPILSVRSFMFRGISGRPLVIEAAESGGVHSLYLRPNASGRHLISSNYLSGGVYLPLSLSGREVDTDLFLSTNGNVGIGTASPSVTLNVGHPNHGIGISYLGASSLPAIAGMFTDSSSGQQGYGSLLIKSRSDFANYSINFYTAETANVIQERMRITSGGNLLVNMTSVASLGNGIALRGDNNGVGGYGYIQISGTGVTSRAMYLYNSNGLVGSLGTDGTNFVFATGSGDNERFRISATGFVSAGVTTNGRLGVRGFTNDSTGYAFEAANSSGNTLFIVRNDAISTFTGRLGIGTYVPQKPLEVIANANDFVSVGVQSLGIGQWSGIHFGYREDNTAYRKSAIVFQRTDLTANDAQGKIHILNGPQGGSGSATLADARLTIAENGHVGIGTTNPLFRTDSRDSLIVSNTPPASNFSSTTGEFYIRGEARYDMGPTINYYPSLWRQRLENVGVFSGTSDLVWTRSANGGAYTEYMRLKSSSLEAPAFVPTSSSGVYNGISLSSTSGGLRIDSTGTSRQEFDANGHAQFKTNNFYQNTERKRTIFGNASVAPSGSITINVTFAAACYVSVCARAGGVVQGLRFNAMTLFGIDTASSSAASNSPASSGNIQWTAVRVSDTSWNIVLTNFSSSTSAIFAYEIEINATNTITN